MSENSAYDVSPKDGAGSALEKLIAVMELLRSPHGCPWDREQTMDKLKPYLIEEAYEVLEAMDDSPAHHCEELGDLLLQIVFQSRIADEDGLFSIREVIQGIIEKLIRRHPHVFGESEADTAQAVVAQWNAIKKMEKAATARQQAENGDDAGSDLNTPPQEREAANTTREQRQWLSPVSTSVPALVRALRVSKEAATVGFDWPSPQPVLDKIREEVEEVAQAMATGDRGQIASELGDLLFAASNLARHYKINPEAAANQTVERFVRRFSGVMELLNEQGKAPSQSNLDEMEALWQEVKRREREGERNRCKFRERGESKGKVESGYSEEKEQG